MERVRHKKWEQFRDRHGDRGRDLVRYLGRRVSRVTLNELARGMGMKEYATVAIAIKRYAACLQDNAIRSGAGRHLAPGIWQASTENEFLCCFSRL